MKIFIFAIVLAFAGNAFGAPQILHSGASVLHLYDRTDSVTFTLVATDSNGLDSLVGAVLVDAKTKASYGIFQTGAQKSAYQITLNFEDFVRVRPVYPEPATGERRVLQAQVYNSKGEMASVDLWILLHSRDTYLPLVGGTYEQLPGSWRKYLDGIWSGYIGTEELQTRVSLRLKYDSTADRSEVFGGDASGNWNFKEQKSGKETFDTYLAACISVQARVLDDTYEKNKLCEFEIRCIRADENVAPACWSKKL